MALRRSSARSSLRSTVDRIVPPSTRWLGVRGVDPWRRPVWGSFSGTPSRERRASQVARSTVYRAVQRADARATASVDVALALPPEGEER